MRTQISVSVVGRKLALPRVHRGYPSGALQRNAHKAESEDSMGDITIQLFVGVEITEPILRNQTPRRPYYGTRRIGDSSGCELNMAHY